MDGTEKMLAAKKVLTAPLKKFEFHDDEDGADDDDRWLNFVCAEHLNLIVVARMMDPLHA